METTFAYQKVKFAPEKPLARAILKEIEEALSECNFTLGRQVREVEEILTQVCGAKYAVGVNSGTDALFLILWAMGVTERDTVVTTPYSFIATANAIANTGARPVFADCSNDYNVDRLKAISKFKIGAKVFLPVWWAGQPGLQGFLPDQDFPKDKIVEDACQAIGGSVFWRPAGSLGKAAAISFHPQKNVNAWGDGGAVVTDDEGLAQEVRLLRNHGLSDRDHAVRIGFNSRLDTVQAIVLKHTIAELREVTEKRIALARRYDQGLASLAPRKVFIPKRDPNVKHVFHLYQVNVAEGVREELLQWLRGRGVEALVHYPVPMHLQESYKALGHKEGDFPVAEALVKTTVSLPLNEHMGDEQVDYVCEQVHGYYKSQTA